VVAPFNISSSTDISGGLSAQPPAGQVDGFSPLYYISLDPNSMCIYGAKWPNGVLTKQKGFPLSEIVRLQLVWFIDFVDLGMYSQYFMFFLT